MQFGDDLQSDIDTMWKSTQGSYEAEYSLCNRVSSVCFTDDPYSEDNLIFKANEYVESKKINHIDILNILDGEDELCFDVVNGKVRMIIKKNYDDTLVTISKP